MPCKRCHSPSISDVVKRFLVENMFLNKNYKLQNSCGPVPSTSYMLKRLEGTSGCWISFETLYAVIPRVAAVFMRET